MSMKKVWVIMALFYNNIKNLYSQFRERVNARRVMEMRIFAVTRIRGRFKYQRILKSAQIAEGKKLENSGVPHLEINRHLLQTRLKRDMRMTLLLHGAYFNSVKEIECKKKFFYPTLFKTSIFHKFHGDVCNFVKIMYKIQDRIRGSIELNRAKISYLKIAWDDAVQKLIGSYAAKNKKKEWSHLISQIGTISRNKRDRILTRYLARCKLSNCLAFF